MSAAGKILSSIRDSVATLTFNNPERHNAVSLEMWRAAAELLENFAADPSVRLVILTGAGDKAFASGADISKFDSERGSADAVATYNSTVERLQQTLLDYPKPTLALIRGYCIGGGLSIALCCDLRIANEKSRFAIPAAKLGLGYSYSSVRHLMDLVGPQFAYEILFTARQFDATEALKMGLVNSVLPDSEIQAYAHQMAEMIGGNAPLTIQAVKRIVREALKEESQRDAAACDLLVQQCFASADYEEGRRAFLEKRKPRFTGR